MRSGVRGRSDRSHCSITVIPACCQRRGAVAPRSSCGWPAAACTRITRPMPRLSSRFADGKSVTKLTERLSNDPSGGRDAAPAAAARIKQECRRRACQEDASPQASPDATRRHEKELIAAGRAYLGRRPALQHEFDDRKANDRRGAEQRVAARFGDANPCALSSAAYHRCPRQIVMMQETAKTRASTPSNT